MEKSFWHRFETVVCVALAVGSASAAIQVLTEGDRYYTFASAGREMDLTDAVRQEGKGSEPALKKGSEAISGQYTVANAFGKGNDKATRVLLAGEENDIEWTIADDFRPGEEIVVTSYTIRRTWFGTETDDQVSRQRAPVCFALEGSTDGKTWQTLDERSDISWETDPTEMEKSFAIAGVRLGSYRIYRFRTFKTTRKEGTSNCGFQYIALKGVIDPHWNYFDEAVGGHGFIVCLDDFKMPLDSKIELDFAFTDIRGTQGLFSNSYANPECKKFRLFNVDGGWRFDYGSAVFTTNAFKAVPNERYRIVVDGPVVTINGEKLFDEGAKLTDAGLCGLALFATTGHDWDSNGMALYNEANVIIYGVKVWDADGNLQHELRPGIMIDGTRALLDGPYGIHGYAGVTMDGTSKQVRTDFRIHGSEEDLVALMRASGVEPVVTSENAVAAGTALENLFSTPQTTDERLLLKDEVTTVNVDIPDAYKPDEPFVLTRFVIVPCVGVTTPSIQNTAEVVMMASQRAPAQFAFQASADGETWTTLYGQAEKLSAATYQQGPIMKFETFDTSYYGCMGVSFEIPEANRGDYRHYRLVTTATNRGASDGTSRWGVQELKLFGVVGGTGSRLEVAPRCDPIEYVQNGSEDKNANNTYFKTGVTPTACDMTIEITGEFTRVGTDEAATSCLFCSRASGSANSWTLFLLKGKLRLDCNQTGEEMDCDIKANEEHTFKVIGNKLYVDGVLKATTGSGNFKPGSEIILMASHKGLSDWDNQARFKLKSCRITDASGSVVRDYMPVKNAENGVGGLFDRVSGSVLPANGTAVRMGPSVGIDFRQRGRAVTLASESEWGHISDGPLTFAFEGNQIAEGTLCAAFYNGSDDEDTMAEEHIVELGVVRNGVGTMTVERPESAGLYRRVKFFIRDVLSNGVSQTRSFGTGLRGLMIIVR